MTTVSSGRCTSAPVPVEIAIGTKPSDATRAVIRTDQMSTKWPNLQRTLTVLTGWLPVFLRGVLQHLHDFRQRAILARGRGYLDLIVKLNLD
jgi:hypothetical protein